MWKPRRNGRTYYYHSVRDGDRVRSIYVGRGATADKLVTKATKRREARIAAAKKRAEFAAAEDQLQGFTRLVNQVLEAMAPRIGIHRHRRQWRRSGHTQEARS